MPSRGTFVDQLEDTVDDVASWGAKSAIAILRALQPDGRAFGEEKQPTAEQLRNYVQTYRGNQVAWDAWINDRVNGIKQRLLSNGVPEEDIPQAIPYNRIQAEAVAYSARMEKLLKKNDERWAGERDVARQGEVSYTEL